MRTLTEWNARMKTMLKDEKGQTMVEYALLLVLIAVVVAALIPGVTDSISAAFTRITTALTPA